MTTNPFHNHNIKTMTNLYTTWRRINTIEIEPKHVWRKRDEEKHPETHMLIINSITLGRADRLHHLSLYHKMCCIVYTCRYIFVCICIYGPFDVINYNIILWEMGFLTAEGVLAWLFLMVNGGFENVFGAVSNHFYFIFFYKNIYRNRLNDKYIYTFMYLCM